jgi:RNA polymerase sigma factor (sigma-70 family)
MIGGGAKREMGAARLAQSGAPSRNPRDYGQVRRRPPCRSDSPPNRQATQVTAQSDPARPRPLRVVGGDRYPNWEAVYQDNAAWVYRTIFARVGNRADAEDLTAEVFLAALRPLRLTASVGEVRGYLRATSRTVLAAHWRATLGREITSIDDIEAPPESDDAVSTAPQRVAELLDALPDQYRRILELRFLQSRSIKESAADMGVSVANAKVLQHRALRFAAQVNDAAHFNDAARFNDEDKP